MKSVLNNKKLILAPLLMVGGALLTACVPHLTEQQCANMDWKQVGFGDGSQGNMPRTLQKEMDDCAKFKIKVNAKLLALVYPF